MARRGPSDAASVQTVLVVVLGLVVAAFAGYVVVRDPAPPTDGTDLSANYDRTTGSGSGNGTDDPTGGSTASGSDSSQGSDDAVGETVSADELPDTEVEVTLNLANNDNLPRDFRVFDTGGNAEPLSVVDGALAHGTPSTKSASYVELQLPGNARRVGANITFGADDETSGAAVLTMWEKSVVKAQRDRATYPRSAVYLLAFPDSWRLGVFDKNSQLTEILASGTYESVSAPAKFQIYRQGATAWVVDPAGGVTSVTDGRIKDWAGPWASWGLFESTADRVPATITKIWAS